MAKMPKVKNILQEESFNLGGAEVFTDRNNEE